MGPHHGSGHAGHVVSRHQVVTAFGRFSLSCEVSDLSVIVTARMCQPSVAGFLSLLTASPSTQVFTRSTRMGEHQSNSPVSSRNRQDSTKTLKHTNRINAIQHLPFIYRQAYPCHMRARSIWLCSTAMDSQTEPLLLVVITGQACAASQAACSLFSPPQQPREAKDEAQEHDSPKSNETDFRADPKCHHHEHAHHASSNLLVEWKSHGCSAHFPSCKSSSHHAFSSAMFTTSLL